MAKKSNQFNSETGSAAGKKSKRGQSLKTILKTVCEDGTIDEIAFIKSLYLNAMKGNSGIAKLIMQYREGNPPQDIKVESKSEVNVKLSAAQLKKVLDALQKEC
jgi:Tfp pilus assembly protein PilW